MAMRFTFGRITAFALVVGLATGGATASYMLSRANFGGSGDGAPVESYARYSGNKDAAGAAGDVSSRCPGCRDSYDMVYLDDPRRPRDTVRIGRDDRIGVAATDRDYAEGLDRPPPETGWGDKRPLESDRPRLIAPPSAEELARAQRTAESEARMAAAARQIERTVVQTATMNDPVTIHRPAQPPAPVSADQPRPGG